MATQMESIKTSPMNYREPDDEDVALHAQQLVNGALKLDNYQPIRELERIKSNGDQALQLAHFSTSQEKKMAESLQRNTNAWIDTAKDVLDVAINVTGLVTTCEPLVKTGAFKPDDVVRASQHAVSAGEALKRIYDRACEMAVNNSNELLLEIDSNAKTRQSLTVTAAAEEHRDDLKKFQQGKVNVKAPHRSHTKLIESIKQTEQNQNSHVRLLADRSSRAWDIATAVGKVVLTVGIILGFAILKR